MLLDPIAQLHLVTILGVVLIFCAALWFVRRAVVPVVEVMERRAAHVAAASAAKAAAVERLAAARRDAEALLAAARATADEETEKVKEATAAHRRTTLDHARAEADALLAQGRDEIAALTRREQARLAEELCACVSEAVRKVAGSADETAVRFTVAELLGAERAR